jgi:catechol 2,3-dioxygenase-like lactoylglutathione lyase family enzyme
MTKALKLALPMFVLVTALILSAGSPAYMQQPAPAQPQSTTHFHHVHLNSTDPAAATDYYIKAFPTSTKVSMGGYDGLKTANVAVLFNKVNTPPPNDPPSAIWHFGWLVPDSRERMATFDQMGLKVDQMYATPDGPMIKITSDSYPGNLTVQQLAEAKANNVQPSGRGGYEYLRGPDNVMFENNGNSPERVDHLHMFATDPVCAQLWYNAHLGGVSPAARGRAGAPPPAPPTMETCKQPYGPPTFPSPTKNGWLRSPTAVVRFDDVAFYIIPKQGSGPLAPTRGQGIDHMGLSVSDLDAMVTKLRGEGVKFLEQPHPWGNTRAAMIEGPDSVSIEIVEVK